MSCALEKIKMAKVSAYIRKHKNFINAFHDANLLSLIHGSQHSPKCQNYSEDFAFLTATSLHSIRKIQLTETSKQDGKQQKIQVCKRLKQLKEKEIEVINKEV